MISQMLRAAQAGWSGFAPGEVRLALEAAEIPSFWRTIHEAQSELRRCRRYEHPLSLLVVAVDGSSLRRAAEDDGGASRSDSWLLRRFECAALLVLGWILRDATRETDAVSYAAENHTYVVVLPETDGLGAEVAAKRFGRLFEQRASASLRVGIATFPHDGFTIEDLFQHARSGMGPIREVPPSASAGDEGRRSNGEARAADGEARAPNGEARGPNGDVHAPIREGHTPSVKVIPNPPAARREATASPRASDEVPRINAAADRVAPIVRRASHG